MKKSTLLRHLFDKKPILRWVGAHNAMGAKLIEKHGFECVWASGFEISTSFGVPDANILSASQVVEITTTINDAVSLPVVLDADTGYGNVNNVIYLVKQLEKHDIAGMVIEDKLFPKVNSFIAGRQELAPIPEFVNKIKAAKNASESSDFMVFARTEALIAGQGIPEAVKRAKEYTLAGADGIFIHSKSKTPDEIIEFINNFDMNIPLVVCPTTYPSFNLKEIKKYPSIKSVIFANPGIRSEIKAMNTMLDILSKENDLTKINEDICSMEEVFEIQGMHILKENEKRYLYNSNEKISVIIPAAGDVKDSQLKEKLGSLPVCMADICGKTSLERNISTLHDIGLQDITVVTGENNDNIDAEGIKKIKKTENITSHILHTIMAAEEKMSSAILIVYSDILFESRIILNLLSTKGDIILVVDDSFKNLLRNKKLNEGQIVLVKTEKEYSNEERVIRHPNYTNRVIRIGKKLDPKDCNFEYIGIAFLSKTGVNLFRKYYYKEKDTYLPGAFNEAESFIKANFYDLLQKMIEDGIVVNVCETHNGWTEIHNLGDYNRTIKQLRH